MVSLKEGVTPPETELADESPEEAEALSLFWFSAGAEVEAEDASEESTDTTIVLKPLYVRLTLTPSAFLALKLVSPFE